MISNAEYLIQKYAEAREKMNDANTESARQYWRGSMDTYHGLLSSAFKGWTAQGTTGDYVFLQGMTYDAALRRINKELLKAADKDFTESCW